jgi:hypothetical protein
MNATIQLQLSTVLPALNGARSSVVVKALCYKLEGCRFKTQ